MYRFTSRSRVSVYCDHRRTLRTAILSISGACMKASWVWVYNKSIHKPVQWLPVLSHYRPPPPTSMLSQLTSDRTSVRWCTSTSYKRDETAGKEDKLFRGFDINNKSECDAAARTTPTNTTVRLWVSASKMSPKNGRNLALASLLMMADDSKNTA